MTNEERAGLIDKLVRKEYNKLGGSKLGSILMKAAQHLPSDLAATIMENGYSKWKTHKLSVELIEKLNAATDDELVALMLCAND